MRGALVKKPELLAPAGSLDVFATAVEEGADAVYIGAPAWNARALAKNFTPEELAAMIDYGHRNGVKVYLAMNSLVKEDEIPQLVELLALLEQLAPDALIIQDLGLYSLVRKYFPSFTLHASTLMGAHNSLAVQQFADMGFKRVVLAREVTLAETQKIHDQCPVELEVFVHGALCFSYSGLCLFSSYLGGKSGLRGRCVQPCRRRYSWADAGKGQQPGYFFSMNDLEAIDLLPQLASAGVVSFKIEGRMRSASYVGAVVKAYRQIIDAGDNIADVLPQVRGLLYDAMGRRPTGGYFTSPQPTDAITPFQTGNIGHYLGRVSGAKGGRVSLVLQETVEPGDRVRLHQEQSGERSSFTVKEIRLDGRVLDRGEKGEAVSLLMPGAQAEAGDVLYKVDVRSRRQMEARKSRLTPSAQFKKMIEKAGKQGRAQNVLKALALSSSAAMPQRPVFRGRQAPAGKQVAGGRRGKPAGLPVWLRGGDLRLLNQAVIDRPERLLVTLDRESLIQLQQQKKSQLHLLKSITWVLPPVILEDDVPFYRQLVNDMVRQGFRQWMVGHIGQLQLFRAATGKGDGGGRRSAAAKLELCGDYTLNVLNSLSVGLLREMGLDTVLLSIEADREALQKVCAHKKKSRTGLVVFGRPPLFTARLQPDFFQFNKTFISPRGERFELVRKWGQTLALPDKPFSLYSQVAQLKEAGFDFVLVDLSFVPLHKKEMAALRKTFATKGRDRSVDTFNFFRTLQ
ncbi:MAG: U32 family peptidase [Proteobacteria bacterium]|nr:U32 family peptidase [Pseudomonadota bacterium]MBU4295575.1 U32 family peptidase [Pseudomonadota bacterium]MCG2747694.1 U32 family peptidase [Desulfobulbaceae bacterium]